MTLEDKIEALVEELERVASTFYQYRTTVMVRFDGIMDGEQWRELNRAFDRLEALREQAKNIRREQANLSAQLTEAKADAERLAEALAQIEVDASGLAEDWEMYGIDRKQARKFAHQLADFARETLNSYREKHDA